MTKVEIDPDKIVRLVVSDHALLIAYSTERALAKAHAAAAAELERARHDSGEAAKDVWLHVTLADKAAVLTDLFPLYSATWHALDSHSRLK
jgi:hypothetical protein